jgi:hypothetical protein
MAGFAARRDSLGTRPSHAARSRACLNWLQEASRCASDGARRLAVGVGAHQVEAAADAHGSLDFVHDQFACGRRFR